jgi:hypothetical protein
MSCRTNNDDDDNDERTYSVPAEAAKQYFVFCVLEKQINNDDKLMIQTTRLTEGK